MPVFPDGVQIRFGHLNIHFVSPRSIVVNFNQTLIPFEQDSTFEVLVGKHMFHIFIVQLELRINTIIGFNTTTTDHQPTFDQFQT